MRSLLLLFISILALSSSAANHYVRLAAAGTRTGADWVNAFTNLPGSYIRGDVYYVADGTYSGGVGCVDAESGTNLIRILKATPADHGTSTGWLDTYGQGQASFSAPIYALTGYYEIDGRYRGNFTNGYGFKLRNFPPVFDTTCVSLGQSSPEVGVKNFTIKYMEVEGSHSVNDAWNDSGVEIYPNSRNIVISHCYIHDLGLCGFFIRGSTNILIEHCYVFRNDSSTTLHAEGVSASEDTVNLTNRFSIWVDMEGTGYLATPSPRTFSSSPPNRIGNWFVYGNVFMYSTGNAGLTPTSLIRGGETQGPLTIFDCQVSGQVVFVNNTMVNLNGLAVCSSGCTAGAGLLMGLGVAPSTPISLANMLVANNLWVNCDTFDLGGTSPGTANFQWMNNAYFNTTVTSETNVNKQVGSGTILSNWPNANFHLMLDTAAWTPLAAPYDVDPDGVTRTSSRGAYQFVVAGAPAGGDNGAKVHIQRVNASSFNTY